MMKKRVMKMAFLMSVCLFLVTVLAPIQPVWATVFTFNPVADAPVREERPDSNLGGHYQLKVWSSPENISFLRFDVQNLDAPVTAATLRLYTIDSSAHGIAVQAVSDNSWDEMAITYNNAPPTGNVINMSGAIAAQSWVEVDVTSYVAGEGLVSLALTTADTNPLRFFSKEGTYAPELIIETGNGTPPPPLNADFTAVPISGNAPLEVTFSDNSTGNITGYDWDFGDGNNSTQPSPVHTYTQPGIYTVSLTVTEARGLTDTLTRTDYIAVEDVVTTIPKIVIDPLSVLLVGVGDTAPLSAVVYDAYGNPDLSAPITWIVDDPAVVSLIANGPQNSQATIEAITAVGSTLITATSGEVSISIPVVVAVLGQDTQVVSAVDVESITYLEGDEYLENPTVTLSRNAETEAITVGSILVTSSATEEVSGLLARVAQVDLTPNQVIVTGEQASLAEAYETLHIQLELPKYDLPAVSATFNSSDPTIQAPFTASAINCEVDTFWVQVELTNFQLDMPLTPVAPVVEIDIQDNELQYLYVGVDIDASFAIIGPQLEISGESTAKFDCEIPLAGSIPLLVIPSTLIAVDAFPQIGIEGEIGLEAGDVVVSTGSLEFDYTARHALEYDASTGEWSTISESSEPQYNYDNDFAIETELDFYYHAEIQPYIKVGLGTSLVGTGSLLRVNIITVQAGLVSALDVPLEAIIFDPYPPSSPYQNPEFDLSGLVEVKLDAYVGGPAAEPFNKLLEEIAYISPIHIEERVMFSLEASIGGTPEITISASPSVAIAGDTVNLSVAARPFPFEGVEWFLFANRPVEFWASRNNGEAFLIGSTTLDDAGNGSISWEIPEDGNYKIVALAFDRALNEVFFNQLPHMTPEITVNQVGIAFEANPDSGAAPLDVIFSWDLTNPNGDPLDCVLVPGDGSSAYTISDCENNITQTHTYTQTGVYTPTLTVDNVTLSTNVEVSAWRYDVGFIGYLSSPVINGTTVYMGGEEGLYAFNADGDLLWHAVPGGVISGTPAVGADGTIYYPSSDDSLYALNPDGSLKWEFQTGHNVNSPAIGNNGVVYIGSLDCNLYAIDPNTGTQIWQLDLGLEPYDCWAQSPVIGVDGTIFTRVLWVGYGPVDLLIAVDPNGTVLWSTEAEEFETFGVPAIDADGTLILQGASLLGVDPTDGDILWRDSGSSSSYYGVATYGEDSYSPSIGPDGTIYIVGGTYIFAINPNNRNVLWQTFLPFLSGYQVVSTPTLGDNGLIYVGGRDYNFYVIDAQNGEILQTLATGGLNWSSPAISPDGMVYFYSNDGYLYGMQTDATGLAESPWPKFRQNNENTGLAQ